MKFVPEPEPEPVPATEYARRHIITLYFPLFPLNGIRTKAGTGTGSGSGSGSCRNMHLGTKRLTQTPIPLYTLPSNFWSKPPWQYHVTVTQMRERIQSAHTMQKSQNT